METINVIDKDAVFLEAMRVFKDAMGVADAFISKYHQLEFQDGIRLLSVEETSRRLGGLNREDVKKLCKSGKLEYYRKNNNTMVISSASVEKYIGDLQKITHNEYFTNEHNVMRRAKAPITRTEIEKFGVK